MQKYESHFCDDLAKMYQPQIAYYKENYPSVCALGTKVLQQNMFVTPVSFAKEHKAVLAHCKHCKCESLVGHDPEGLLDEL